MTTCRYSVLAVALLLTCHSGLSEAQQFPWKPGDEPPAAGRLRLGESLAQLDSTLGKPTAIKWPRAGRESRIYQGRGLSIIADSTVGVIYVLLFTREAGDLGGLRVGDTRERVQRLLGPQHQGRGESTRYIAGNWTIQVQLDATSEFVENLSIGRSDLFPEEEFGFLATLKRIAVQLYDAGESAGLLGFLTLADFLLWRKYRYWIPRYVHLLAVGAFLLICWLNWMWIRAGGELTVRRVIIILFFPAIVYLFFIGAGGVRAAMSKRE